MNVKKEHLAAPVLSPVSRIVLHQVDRWSDGPLSKDFGSTVEYHREQRTDEVFLSAAIVSGECEPFCSLFTTDFDGGEEHAAILAGELAKSGKCRENEKVAIWNVPVPLDNIVDEAYDAQTIVRPGYAKPILAIERPIRYFQTDEWCKEIEIVAAIVKEEDEEDDDMFVLYARADYGDGEGFREVVQVVYDEHLMGKFRPTDTVTVYRITVSLDYIDEHAEEVVTVFEGEAYEQQDDEETDEDSEDPSEQVLGDT